MLPASLGYAAAANPFARDSSGAIMTDDCTLEVELGEIAGEPSQ